MQHKSSGCFLLQKHIARATLLPASVLAQQHNSFSVALPIPTRTWCALLLLVKQAACAGLHMSFAWSAALQQRDQAELRTALQTRGPAKAELWRIAAEHSCRAGSLAKGQVATSGTAH